MTRILNQQSTFQIIVNTLYFLIILKQITLKYINLNLVTSTCVYVHKIWTCEFKRLIKNIQILVGMSTAHVPKSRLLKQFQIDEVLSVRGFLLFIETKNNFRILDLKPLLYAINTVKRL